MKRRVTLCCGSAKTVEAYLPENYGVVTENADGTVTIEGEDVRGWTLDGYVLPRLAQWQIYPKLEER